MVSSTPSVGDGYLVLEVSTDEHGRDKVLDPALVGLCSVSSEQERAQLADLGRVSSDSSSEQERTQHRSDSICKKPLVHPRAVGDLPRFMLHVDEDDVSNNRVSMLHTDEHDVPTDGGRLGSVLVAWTPPDCMVLSWVQVPPLSGDASGCRGQHEGLMVIIGSQRKAPPISQREQESHCKMPLVHTRRVFDLPRFMMPTDDGDVATDAPRLGSLLVASSPTCCMVSSSVPKLSENAVGSSLSHGLCCGQHEGLMVIIESQTKTSPISQPDSGSLSWMPLVHTLLVDDLPRFTLHADASNVETDGDGVRCEVGPSECANSLAGDAIGC